MKKIFLIPILGISMFIIVACGFSKESGNNNVQNNVNAVSEPTVQILQNNDIIGFWQVTDYNGKDMTASASFIEFTGTTMKSYNNGEYDSSKDEAYSVENSQMILFSKEYSIAIDDDLLLLAPSDPSDPLILAEKSSQEEMDKLVEAANSIDISLFLEKEWNYTGDAVAPGSDTNKNALYNGGTLIFRKDGTFYDSRGSDYKGSYVIDGNTVIMTYTLFGHVYKCQVDIEGTSSSSKLEMTLMTEDQKFKFFYRAYP